MRARRENKPVPKRTYKESDEEDSEEDQASDEEDDDKQEDDFVDDDQASDKDDDNEKNTETTESAPLREITLNDLMVAVVKRTKLEKWYDEPYWKKSVIGLFVRAMVGQNNGNRKVYRIAEISDITETNYHYKLTKKDCGHLLTLKIGDITKNLEIKYVSNDNPTQEEFQFWTRHIYRAGEHTPTLRELELLGRKIRDADNYTWTEEDFNEREKKAREKNLLPINAAKEKLRLVSEIEQQTQLGNSTKVAELRKQLEELQEKEIPKTPKNFDVSKINKKNQEKNNIAQDAGRSLLLSQSENQRDGGDPFARRKTEVGLSWAPVSKKRNLPDREDTPMPKKQKIVRAPEAAVIPTYSNTEPTPIFKPPSYADLSTSNDKTLSLSDYRRRRSGAT